MKVTTLKIRIKETICMHEGTAPSAVKFPIPSPYFQPSIAIRVEKEVDWSSGSPRGPTVVIDMDIFGTSFE